MSIYRALDKLESAITNSSRAPWPWNNTVLVAKDKILNLIEAIRASLPEEIKQARWITKDKEKHLKEAQEKSEKIVADSEKSGKDILHKAHEEANRMVAEHEIINRAKQQADEIIQIAEDKARSLLDEVDKKAKNEIGEAQNHKTKILSQAEKEAGEMRTSAQEFAVQVFSAMEKELTKILTILQKGKQEVLPGKKE